MPRPLRTYSNSKIYHIILKGIDSQDIFYNNDDRNFFLNQIQLTKKQFYFQVYAYCLMSNHIHMVIRVENDFLSKSMQSLSIRYAHYFNQKYERVGPFLQNRFKSKNVENQRYFMDVCRYVHRNPEKAKISKTEDYKWSSYKEYIGKEKIINKKVLLHYFDNNIDEFIKYTIGNKYENINDFAEYEMIDKLSDEKLADIICNLYKLENKQEIKHLFKNKTNEDIENNLLLLKEISGTNITQISRVIGVNRKKIKKIFK